MIHLDVADIGERIAYYRKLNGITAQELAEAAGAGLTRAIIANIESGRRQDIGIVPLLSIAWALGVPPAALIVPLTEPNSTLVVDEDEVAVWQFARWLNSDLSGPPWPSRSGALVGDITRTWSAWLRALANVRIQRDELQELIDASAVADAREHQAELARQSQRVEQAEQSAEVYSDYLRVLGVKLEDDVADFGTRAD